MFKETQYYPLPQPEEIPEREKEDAMGAYLMMFAALGAGLPLPIINLIAAIIYYYINKSNSRFVNFHTFQAMLAQLPTSVLNAIGVFWALRIILSDDWHLTNLFKGYIVMVVIANLFYFIFNVVAAVKARKGRMYYFMFFGNLSYHKAFSINENTLTPSINTPPKF